MISVNAAVTIIERDVMLNDHTVLVDEAWQTLKAAVLAQQSNNSDYAAALRVWSQYRSGTCLPEHHPFTRFCEERLNAEGHSA